MIMRYFIKYASLFIMLTMSNMEFTYAQNRGAVIFNDLKVEQSKDYMDGNIYQKDLLLFFDMLKSTHPIFALDATQLINIEKASAVGYEWAKNCTSTQFFWNYLQNVASSLRDGHTTLYPDYNNSKIYPFMYLEVGGKFYLYTVTRQFSSYLGKQIVKINDYPIEMVIESFKPIFSCDNDANFSQKARNQISFEILWAGNPYINSDNTLKLTFSDSVSINIEPKTANNRDLTVLQTQRNPSSIRQSGKDLFLYKILENQDICYLQFNICGDQSSLRLDLMNNNQGLNQEQIEQALSKYPRFDAFLRTMFEEMESKNIKTLVIDVRNNSGGNSSLCNVLLSWLKNDAELISESSYSRLSLLWEINYPQLAHKYKDAFVRNKMDYNLGNLYDNKILSGVLSESGKYKVYDLDYEELFMKNKDENKVFKGNVIFIQNQGTYSSAGQLITDAKDNNIGMVVGSGSTFKPCHYGDVLQWALPNTGINGSISHKYFLRPDSSKCGETSIMSDINIDYTWDDVLNSVDPYWSWIIENYGVK